MPREFAEQEAPSFGARSLGAMRAKPIGSGSACVSKKGWMRPVNRYLRRHSLLNLRSVDPEDRSFNSSHGHSPLRSSDHHIRSETVAVELRPKCRVSTWLDAGALAPTAHWCGCPNLHHWRILTPRTAGVDVKLPLEIATANGASGRSPAIEGRPLRGRFASSSCRSAESFFRLATGLDRSVATVLRYRVAT